VDSIKLEYNFELRNSWFGVFGRKFKVNSILFS